MRDLPMSSIAAGFGLAGGAKLAGAKFTRDNFKRWGYPDAFRVVVGVTEVGLAAGALAGLARPENRRVVAIGTLLTMAGAAATHARAGDAAPNYLPVAGLSAAALAALRG